MSEDYNENSKGSSDAADSSSSDIYTDGKADSTVRSAGTDGSDDYYQYRNSSSRSGTYSSASSDTGSSGSGSDSYSSDTGNSGSYTGSGYGSYSGGSGSSGQYTGGQYTGTGGQYTGGQYSGGGYNPYSGGSGYSGGGDKKPKQKKKKKHGTAFAVVLALIIGIGAGAGAYGISAAVGSGAVRSLLGGSSSSSGSGNNSVASGKSDSDNSSQSSGSSDSADSSTESAAEAEEKAGIVKGNSTSQETDVTDVVDTVMPSMVSVYNKYTEETNYFGQSYSQEEESTGSGIIIGQTDSELLIVTNNHVVADADELHVQFIDEQQAEANIKGTDSTNDLAVISVALDDIKSSTIKQIKVATLGSSDNLKLGEECVAIGNALGYGQSVTVGYISALNREIQSDDGTVSGTFIQTDAAINPGNSGGALCNLSGEVIGINSSKIGGNSVEGMGFAIPISRAEPIITDLMNETTKTKVDEDKQGTLGISGVTVTSDVASAYDIPQGVYVSNIIDGGGAASSDLQVGDVITAINKSTISSMEDLKKQLQYYEAGTEVTLTVQRRSGNSYKEQQIKLTLGDQDSISNSQSGNSSGSGSNSSNGDGSGSGSTEGNSGGNGGSSGFSSGSIFGY